MAGKKLPLDNHLESMLICAERYAMGRRTYIVSEVVGYIIPLIPYLTDNTISVMCRDFQEVQWMVERSGQESLWGDDCDKMDWSRLYDSLLTERQRRDATMSLNKGG